MRKRYLVAVVGVLVLALAATGIAVGKAGKGPHHTFSLNLTGTKKAGKSAGIAIKEDRYDYVAPPAGQPANPVTGITWQMPAGTKVANSKVFKKSVLAKCSQAKLGSSGDPKAAGCPAIGKGSAVAITGFGPPIDPVGENITAYAGPNVVIGRLTPKGSIGQTANIYIKISGSKLVVGVPKFCLPGDDAATPQCDKGEAVLTTISTTIKKKSKGKNVLITSGKCPKSKTWTSTATLKFRTGPSEKVKSTQKCSRSK